MTATTTRSISAPVAAYFESQGAAYHAQGNVDTGAFCWMISRDLPGDNSTAFKEAVINCIQTGNPAAFDRFIPNGSDKIYLSVTRKTLIDLCKGARGR
ncbi:MAG: hypothetical protein AB7G80_06740 [Dongiaceae bacterium]